MSDNNPSSFAGNQKYVSAADNEVYRQTNRRLISLAGLHDGQRILDVACGTGSILSLLIESNSEPASMVGIDTDAAMASAAQERLGDSAHIVRGDVAHLESYFEASMFDVVIVANSVHLFPDISGAIAQIGAVLTDCGRLAMSTAFYDESIPTENRPLYGQLMIEVRRIARRRGLTGHTSRALAVSRSLSVGVFEREISDAEMTIVSMDQEVVDLPLDFLIQLVSTPMFAASVLPGTRAEEACEIMQEAVLAVAEKGYDGIKRRWLYLVAEKGSPNGRQTD